MGKRNNTWQVSVRGVSMKRRLNTLHLAAACSMLQVRGTCRACVAANPACGGQAGRCLLVPTVQLTKLLVDTFPLCCILAAGSACHLMGWGHAQGSTGCTSGLMNYRCRALVRCTGNLPPLCRMVWGGVGQEKGVVALCSFQKLLTIAQ